MEALPFSALWMIEMARAHMNNRPMRSDNERVILEIVRRYGSITRAAVTGLTNLTQQSVHRIIDALLEEELLALGAPVIQGRGKPSPLITLNPAARHAIGVSINTDSVAVCIIDFTCAVIHQERLSLPMADRASALAALRDRLDRHRATYRLDGKRLAGIGFAVAGFFVGENRHFAAPQPLRDWSLVDLACELRALFGTKVWTENGATSAAIAECVLGAGLTHDTFGYLSFNYGFGGGIVIDGRPVLGAFGNAGEISRIFTPEESPSRPALAELIARINAKGGAISTITELYETFDPNWPGVAEWVTEVAPHLNRAIDAMRAVIDPAAVILGGELPPALGEMFLKIPPTPEVPRYGRVANYPAVTLSSIQGDPSVLGAAIIPLKSDYFT